MCKVFCTTVVILLLIIADVILIDARLDSEKCKKKPVQKHCLIEWAVRERWPHQVRYVFDWTTQKCFEIRWAAHCPAVPTPPATNNFDSEHACLDHCSGWA